MPKHQLCSSVYSAKGKALVTKELTCSRKQNDFDKLPKLDLPSFSRNYLDRISFFDHFKGAIIYNNQLKNSLRVQYLKSAVKGEASKMLTSIIVTDNNFDAAMEILLNQYVKKRFILRANIHGIVSYWPVSNENTRKLRKLVHSVGTQTFSSQHETNSWTSGTLLCLLDCRKSAQQKTKILGVFFQNGKNYRPIRN